MNCKKRAGIAVIVIVALAAGGAYWGLRGDLSDVEAAVEIGGAMPQFDLKDATGKAHQLSQYKGKIVVLEFCSHKCPYSRGADPHLSALAKDYADKGVVFLGVDSHYATTAEEIEAYVKEAKKTYPILKDPQNRYADAVGARVTPEIFIVDKAGKVAYHGAFDNRSNPEKKGEESYVADALAALVADKPVEKTSAKTWGCSIKRAR